MNRKSERIASILADWRLRRDAGEDIRPEELYAAFPEYADALREHFAVVEACVPEAARPVLSKVQTPEAIGDFRLIREIGRGGMGVVYEAEQSSMRRRVALKVLTLDIAASPQAVKRFEREARAAGRIHHTNIVPIYAMGQHDGRWFYAMELIEGRSLGDAIREMKSTEGQSDSQNVERLTPSSSGEVEPSGTARTGSGSRGTGSGDRAYFVRVAELFGGVADALQAAHQEGIIHRDVKPSNLMLDRDGVLKLVDFGLAQSAEAGPEMTRTGDLLGTPLYMSPEQAMAKRIPIDHRTDIYSLGASLYEVLTLAPPHDGESLPELCTKIITKDPVLPRRRNRRIPRDLETVVLKAMEKDRDRRYQTARDFARDLRAFAEGGAIRARPIGPTGRAYRKIMRHKTRSALVAAVLLLAIAGTLVGAWALREASRRREGEYVGLCAQAHELLARHGESGILQTESGPILDLGEAAPAEDVFSRAIELLPDRPDAWVGRALAGGRTTAERLSDLDEARSRGLGGRAWHLARAEVRRGEGRFAAVEEEELEAARFEPEGPLDLLLEGRLSAARLEHERAEELLTRALESSSDGHRLLALRLRAIARERSGDFEGALSDLMALRAEGDAGPGTRVRIALLWRRLGRTEKATTLLEDLLDDLRREGDEEDWVSVAFAFHVIHDAQDWADRVTAEAFDVNPDSPRLLRARSATLVHLRRYEEAVAVAERAVKIAPEDADVHRMHGVALFRAGRIEEAAAANEECLRIDPGDRRAQMNRSAFLIKLGHPEEALETLDRSLERIPHQPFAHANRAYVLSQLGRQEEALQSLDSAVRLDPLFFEARGRRVIVLAVGLERRDEALEAADELCLVARSPSELAVAHVARGRALLAASRAEEALQEFEEALRNDADCTWAPRGHGVILNALGRYDEALSALSKAVEYEPTDAGVRANRAAVLMNLRRPEEALVELNAAAALSSAPIPQARVFSNRSVLFLGLGRVDEALADAERATSLDPESATAWAQLGLCLLQSHQTLEEAVAALDRAVEIEADCVPAHLHRASAEQRRRRPKEALAAADQALGALARGWAVRMGWQSSPALGHVARSRALRALDRLPEALEAAEEAIAADPDSEEGWVAKADILRCRGLYEETVKVAEAGPADSPSLLLQRSVALDALGRGPDSRACAKRALELDDGTRLTPHARARLLYLLHRFPEARQVLDRALLQWPADLEMSVLLAFVLLDVDMPDESFAVFKSILGNGGEDARIHRGSGRALMALDRPSEALASLKLALTIDAGNARIHLDLGRALEQLDRRDDALAAWDKAIRLDPHLRDAFYAKARLFRELGSPEEAVLVLESWLVGHEQDADAYCDLSGHLHALGRYEESEAAARRAIAIAPGFAPAHSNLGATLDRRGRNRESLAADERACELAPNNAEYHRNRGIALYRLGRTKEALAAQERAVEIDPTFASAYREQAQLLLMMGDPQNALDAIKQALKLDAEFAEAHAVRAAILLELGQEAEALEASARSLELAPEDGLIHIQRALFLSKLGRHATALEAADRAVELEPSLPDGHDARGVILMKLGEGEDALAAHKRATELQPENPGLLTNFASALIQNGLFEDSIVVNEEALALDRENPKALGNRGAALLTLGRTDEGLASFEQAMKAQPGEAMWAAGRAQALLALNRVEEALECAGKAVAMEPPRAPAHLVMGMVLVRLGRPEEAVTAFSRAIELEPGRIGAYRQRALVYWKLRKPDEALMDVKVLLERLPEDANLHAFRGLLLLQAGRAADALVATNKSLDLSPGTPFVQDLRGSALLNLGRAAEAVDAYDAAIAGGIGSPTTLSNRAWALAKAGRSQEALQAVEALAERGVRTPTTTAAHAEAFLGLRRFDDALRVCGESIAGMPEAPPQLHVLRARALLGLRRPRAALDALDAQLERGPGNAGLRYWRALALRTAGRLDEALTASREGLREQPGYRHAWQEQIAWILDARGEPDLAVEQWRAALELAPGCANCQCGLAIALAWLGRFEEANVELAKAADAPDQHGGFRHFVEASLSLLMGRPKEALVAAKEYDALEADGAGWLKVRCLLSVGDEERARAQAAEHSARDPGETQHLDLAYLAAVAGEKDRAERLLAEYDLPMTPFHTWERALVHAVLRDAEATLDWLDRAAKAGYRRPAKAPVDAEFKWLSDDPRFQARLAALRR